ncbi:alpha/beta fold hydrolase [Duganella sp. FT92W]|uniref:Alpha/beta fold hydrolase n=2 Tax=Pseudoduganella rivuli TaxID=2666085 RepID=A0A7X2ITC3_9BURK|nr:alpha/beta fold hydrolase [Pseudoduganella rivuli]
MMVELQGYGRLHYEWIDGPQQRPVLVFLHEGLGCTAMWKDFPARLCALAGCPGLVYDRLGYGLSDPLTRARSVHYLHEYTLIELPAVLERLLPARPYIVIGHSDGGSIALLHGAAQPANLLGVLTEAAHVFVEDVTLAGIRTALDAWEAGKLRGLERYHGDKTGAIFHAWADTWLTPAFSQWNIEGVLASIACPVLALQGEGDQYGTAAQLASIASRAPRAMEHMLPDCGHTPHLDNPDATLAAMAAFISRL